MQVQIRRLKITRFRGLEKLTWHPGRGVNCLTGAGDVGKSTVLEAIATLLSPAPGRIASEHDYFRGAVEDGFGSMPSSEAWATISSRPGAFRRFGRGLTRTSGYRPIPTLQVRACFVSGRVAPRTSRSSTSS